MTTDYRVRTRLVGGMSNREANQHKWERLRKWADENEDRCITLEEWKLYVVMKNMDLFYGKIAEVSRRSTNLADFIVNAHAELNAQIVRDNRMAYEDLHPTVEDAPACSLM